MSSKTTRRNQVARMRLAEARAKSLSNAIEQIVNILSADFSAGENALAVAEAAKAQDDQRTEPERIRRNLKDLREAINRAAEEADE